MKALPIGRGQQRTRLWDEQYRLIWDSTTATTPAYPHINTQVNATIDYPNGYRWCGRMTRTPNGIERSQHWDILRYIQIPPNPLFETRVALTEPNYWTTKSLEALEGALWCGEHQTIRMFCERKHASARQSND